MVENIKVNGSITIWMESVYTPGKTDASTKVNTRMIRNTASEFTFGQMEESTGATGPEVNNTVLEYTQFQIKAKNMDFGRKENASSGLTKSRSI